MIGGGVAEAAEHDGIGRQGSLGSFRVLAMPMLNAAPTAFGKWEAMVLVCGGIDSGFEPITL
jgi:hypothetical protein